MSGNLTRVFLTASSAAAVVSALYFVPVTAEPNVEKLRVYDDVKSYLRQAKNPNDLLQKPLSVSDDSYGRVVFIHDIKKDGNRLCAEFEMKTFKNPDDPHFFLNRNDFIDAGEVCLDRSDLSM